MSNWPDGAWPHEGGPSGAWPSGDGEMARCIRAFDWSATALGPLETWPERRKGVIDAVLANGLPMCVLWGPDLLWIYNDAQRPLIGLDHPAAFGRPLRHSLPETWSSIESLLARAYAGETLRLEDTALPSERAGAPEAAWFTFSLAPLRDADGQVVGVLASAVESSGRIRTLAALRSRDARQAFLIRVKDGLLAKQQAVELQREAVRLLGEHLGAQRCIYSHVSDARSGALCARAQYAAGLAELAEAALELARLAPALLDAYRAHEGVVVEDVERDGRLAPEARARYRASWIRAFAARPVIAGGVWVGTLEVHADGPRRWAREELELLEEVADELGSALARASADAALRTRQARQAFLVQLNDSLRPLCDPIEIKGEACRMLGEHLRTDRTYYVELDHVRQSFIVERDYVRGSAPSLVGEHRFELYPFVMDAMRNGRRFSPEDVATDPRIGEVERCSLTALAIGSYAAVPIVKRGEVVALMCVANVGARRWAAEELSELEDVAERTWDAVQRARTEAALRESESRLRVITELAPALLSETDPHGNRVPVNQRWYEYTGQTQHAARGRDWLAALHPDDRERSERAFSDAFAAEEPLELEHRICRHDGEYRWFLERQQPMRDEQGKLVGWLGVATDVHEQRASLEVARAARAEAELANRIKDDFLATLSHELRTPMAAILLWVSALRSGALPAAELSRGLESIALSAESLSRLIEDLLDLSRLASGKVVLSQTPVDVAKVCGVAVEMVRPTARAKRIELVSDVARDVGIALLDGMRLQQILCNLLANATKFTPDGGAVKLRVRRLDARIELVVEDTGQGIPPEFMPHLFEKFSQADMRDTRQHSGLGIGLALTKQLVELHGGTIAASSAGPGQGAIFRVLLPWLAPEAGAASKSNPYAGGLLGAPLAGVRVLLVEDDASTLEAMRATLVSAGAVVIAAGNGTAALAALAEAGADFIVSDIGLPGMSGLELMTRIVQDYRRSGRTPPPACAISAYAHAADRQRGIDAGFDLYLTKPLAPKRLLEAVSDLRDIAASARD